MERGEHRKIACLEVSYYSLDETMWFKPRLTGYGGLHRKDCVATVVCHMRPDQLSSIPMEHA